MELSKHQTHHGKLKKKKLLTLIYIDFHVKYLFFSEVFKTRQEQSIFKRGKEGTKTNVVDEVGIIL